MMRCESLLRLRRPGEDWHAPKQGRLGARPPSPSPTQLVRRLAASLDLRASTFAPHVVMMVHSNKV